jgi:hypothetical protein
LEVSWIFETAFDAVSCPLAKIVQPPGGLVVMYWWVMTVLLAAPVAIVITPVPLEPSPKGNLTLIVAERNRVAAAFG